jgi:hypothetical protein
MIGCCGRLAAQDGGRVVSVIAYRTASTLLNVVTFFEIKKKPCYKTIGFILEEQRKFLYNEQRMKRSIIITKFDNYNCFLPN